MCGRQASVRPPLASCLAPAFLRWPPDLPLPAALRGRDAASLAWEALLAGEWCSPEPCLQGRTAAASACRASSGSVLGPPEPRFSCNKRTKELTCGGGDGGGGGGVRRRRCRCCSSWRASATGRRLPRPASARTCRAGRCPAVPCTCQGHKSVWDQHQCGRPAAARRPSRPRHTWVWRASKNSCSLSSSPNQDSSSGSCVRRAMSSPASKARAQRRWLGHDGTPQCGAAIAARTCRQLLTLAQGVWAGAAQGQLVERGKGVCARVDHPLQERHLRGWCGGSAGSNTAG